MQWKDYYGTFPWAPDVAVLATGLQPFLLYYLRQTQGTPLLGFEWCGPDTPQPVPASVFFYKKDE